MSDYPGIKEEDLAPTTDYLYYAPAPTSSDHSQNLESGESQLEHRGKKSKGNEDEVKDEIGSNKSWNREYEKVKPTCGNCGKSVTRQRIGVHEMLCYRRAGVASEKTTDRFGYFKACGKCGKTFTHTGVKRHEDSCQGDTPRMGKTEKTLNGEFQNRNVKPTCGNCGKSLSRQSIGVHEMLCYRRDGEPSEKTVDRFGYFKVCGKCGKTFTHSRIKGHEDTCQGDTPRATCKEDHEHKTVDEQFDNLEAAVTFFYDNMLDAEFSVRESHKRGQSG